MTPSEFLEHCLVQPGACLDHPWGPEVAVVKVGGRIFAQSFMLRGVDTITLCCDADAGEIFRQQYPGTVVRGYHCPPVIQPYFNSLPLNSEVPDDVILAMIGHSYTRVVSKLTKAKRAELEKDHASQNAGDWRAAAKQEAYSGAIIRTHAVTLTDDDITLIPLCDDHLPLLYRWNADPEVLYWTEGEQSTDTAFDQNDVNYIYGKTSQNAFCFLITTPDGPIGECWLQAMNLPEARKKLYLPGEDIRRIDIAIGEKAYWGKGIGTRVIGMLAEFAFTQESVGAVHYCVDDYNLRSRRACEKNGFVLALELPHDPPHQDRRECHYQLRRQDYLAARA